MATRVIERDTPDGPPVPPGDEAFGENASSAELTLITGDEEPHQPAPERAGFHTVEKEARNHIYEMAGMPTPEWLNFLVDIQNRGAHMTVPNMVHLRKYAAQMSKRLTLVDDIDPDEIPNMGATQTLDYCQRARQAYNAHSFLYDYPTVEGVRRLEKIASIIEQRITLVERGTLEIPPRTSGHKRSDFNPTTWWHRMRGSIYEQLASRSSHLAGSAAQNAIDASMAVQRGNEGVPFSSHVVFARFAPFNVQGQIIARRASQSASPEQLHGFEQQAIRAQQVFYGDLHSFSGSIVSSLDSGLNDSLRNEQSAMLSGTGFELLVNGVIQDEIISSGRVGEVVSTLANMSEDHTTPLADPEDETRHLKIPHIAMDVVLRGQGVNRGRRLNVEIKKSEHNLPREGMLLPGWMGFSANGNITDPRSFFSLVRNYSAAMIDYYEGKSVDPYLLRKVQDMVQPEKILDEYDRNAIEI